MARFMPHSLLLKEAAMRIYTNLAVYLVNKNNKPNNALESFPGSFEAIPWRRIYTKVDAYVATGLIDVMWSPNELSRGGSGSLWCFTLLPRSGENGEGKIIRTDGGHSWKVRTGRLAKNGYPYDELLVDKLLLDSYPFEMLEITEREEDKPIVALCKISRTKEKKKTTAAHKPVMVASPSGESSSNQQMDDLSNITGQMQQMMEIDKIQQVNPESPTNMPAFHVQINDGYCGSTPSQENHESPMQKIMPISEVHMNDNHFDASTRGKTIWGTPSMRESSNSTFQEALSFLVLQKDEFEKIVCFDQNVGNMICSSLQTAACYMRNALGNAAAASSANSAPSAQLQIPVQEEPPANYHPNQAAVEEEVDTVVDNDDDIHWDDWIEVNGPDHRAD